MHPIILSLDPLLKEHFSHLTMESLATSLAELLPQALAQLRSDAGSVDLSSNHDLRGLHPSQVLTLQLATLESFLGASAAVSA